LSDVALLAHISAVYAEHRGAYGWPRIWRELVKRGTRVGKQGVQRLMQKHGIRARGNPRAPRPKWFNAEKRMSRFLATRSALRRPLRPC
jgi:transposase InsO family protein